MMQFLIELGISLYILTWTPCINRMLNIGGWGYLPRSEASNALGTIPSGLRATLYLSPARPTLKHLWFFYHIIPYPSFCADLFSLSLRFFRPRLLPTLRCFILLPYPQDIQGWLLPPLPG